MSSDVVVTRVGCESCSPDEADSWLIMSSSSSASIILESDELRARVSDGSRGDISLGWDIFV